MSKVGLKQNSLKPTRPWANRWHRACGLVASVGLAYLMATGLPLQFTDSLSLDARHIKSNWILNRYGVGLNTATVVVTSEQHPDLVSDQKRLYWQGNVIAELNGFTGAASVPPWLLVTGQTELLIIDPQSLAIVERQPAPATIIRVATGNRPLNGPLGQISLWLDTQAGLFVADAELANWISVDSLAEPTPRWDVVTPLTPQLAHPYIALERQQILSWERWLQDLHSGRFFGYIGVLAVDFVSVLILLLTFTGLTLWWRSRNF